MNEGADGFAVEVSPPRDNEEPIIAVGIDREADARLIAAAPDLYEALRRIADKDAHYITTCPTHAPGCGQDCDSELARAAIAKAEGDTHKEEG